MKIRLIACRRLWCNSIILTRGFRKLPNARRDRGAPTPMELIKKKTAFKVAIEGNIGAGKSTLLQYFSKIPKMETYGEPIDWWRNVNGHNLLDLMYSNIQEWLRVFQSYVQLTRLKVQSGLPKNPKTTIQIFERSVQNNRYCFLELARKNGAVSEPDFVVLDEWFQWIYNNVNIDLDLIIYLRTTPEVVYERIKARARPEEKGMSLDYLTQLHEAHEEWLINGKNNKIPVLVLDANQTVDDVHEQFKAHEDKILDGRIAQ